MMQLSLFADPAPSAPQPTPAARPATPTVRQPTAAQPAPTNRRPSRTDNAKRFGQWLQTVGCPYVAVDEAKRATFRDAKLQRFDFIVYTTNETNWLAYVGQRRKPAIEGMRAWEDVFGDGFKALFAVPRGDGFVYRTLDGHTVANLFSEPDPD